MKIKEEKKRQRRTKKGRMRGKKRRVREKISRYGREQTGKVVKEKIYNKEKEKEEEEERNRQSMMTRKIHE